MGSVRDRAVFMINVRYVQQVPGELADLSLEDITYATREIALHVVGDKYAPEMVLAWVREHMKQRHKEGTALDIKIAALIQLDAWIDIHTF